MREYKTVNIQKQAESKLICNRCGLEYGSEEAELEEWHLDTMFQFQIHFGYFTHHDLENWTFDLCEKCIEEIVSAFRIKPKVENYDPFH